jgi:hypothetical protein
LGSNALPLVRVNASLARRVAPVTRRAGELAERRIDITLSNNTNLVEVSAIDRLAVRRRGGAAMIAKREDSFASLLRRVERDRR